MGGYWKTKIKRLFTPYILIVVIVFVIDALIKRTFTLPYYWYVDFQLYWYLIFFLIMRSPNVYARRKFVFLLLSVATFLVASIAKDGLRAEQAIAFYVGVSISDNNRIKDIIAKSHFFYALLFLGSVLLALKQIPVIRMHEETWLWFFLQLCMKTSFALGIIGGIYKFKSLFYNPTIQFLGQSSYQIYLVHQRVQALVGDGFMGTVWFTIITLLGTILIQNLSHAIIDRSNKINSWMEKIKNESRNSKKN